MFVISQAYHHRSHLSRPPDLGIERPHPLAVGQGTAAGNPVTNPEEDLIWIAGLRSSNDRREQPEQTTRSWLAAQRRLGFLLVVEIGPGQGALRQGLLQQARVIDAVKYDGFVGHSRNTPWCRWMNLSIPGE